MALMPLLCGTEAFLIPTGQRHCVGLRNHWIGAAETIIARVLGLAEFTGCVLQILV